MKPTLKILQERLDEVKSALQSNRSQVASLSADFTQLQDERDDLQAAIDFLKARP